MTLDRRPRLFQVVMALGEVTWIGSVARCKGGLVLGKLETFEWTAARLSRIEAEPLRVVEVTA